MDVLLTDASSRISYSALRSLCSLGLKVAVADTSLTGMCQWSRLPSAKFTYSPPLSRQEDFVRDVVWILKETGAKFLLPGYDETEVLAKYRDRVPADVVMPIASYENISLANDKGRTLEYAKGLGVPVPEIIEWRTFKELEDRLREDGSVVVKLRRGNSAKGVFYAGSAEEAVGICRRLIEKYGLPPERYPLVQRKVYGPKWTVSCVYDHGKELSFITQKMLREKPVSGGTSTYRVTDRNEEIEDYTRRMLEGMGWHGIIMVEYKYDPRTGRFWFMELNPRLWGAISHAVAADADFVKILYTASTQGLEKARAMVRPPRLGVYGRWILGDVMICMQEMKRLHLWSAVKVLMPEKTHDYDEFKLDDPIAFFGEVAYFVKKTLVKSYSKIPAVDEGLG